MRLRTLRFLLLLAVVFATMLAHAAECVGRNPSARTLLIVFGCDRVKSSNVHWFMPKGQYGDQFAATHQTELTAPSALRPIKPADIPMAFEGGGDCVAGEAITLHGECIARYDLPCAEKQFELLVDVDLPPEKYSYSVSRAIRRKNAASRCDVKPTDAATIYSDSEHVTVSVFLKTSEVMPVLKHGERIPFYRSVLRLDEVTDRKVETWDPKGGPQVADKVRRAPSDNALWLAGRTATVAAKVTIEVKRVQ